MQNLETADWNGVGRGTWYSHLLFSPFQNEYLTSRQRQAMETSLAERPEVSDSSVNLVVDQSVGLVQADLAIESRDFDSAIADGFVAALGALAGGEVDIAHVRLVTARLTNDRQLAYDRRIDPTAEVADKRYQLPDQLAQRFYDAQEMYADLLGGLALR